MREINDDDEDFEQIYNNPLPFKSDSSELAAKPSSYRVSKKIFWPVVAGLAAVLITLLVLTIYFGVNQKRRTDVDNESRTTTTSTETTTTPPRPPVARIPTDLQEQLYQLKIAPDLIDPSPSFLGDLLYTFTCVKRTNQLILHMVDLTIDNATLLIVNSSSTARPTFQSWSYDDYNELATIHFSSDFEAGHTYTIRIGYAGDLARDLHGLYISDYVNSDGDDRVLLASQMEPTYARRVLPCVDEPARKAIFQISVVHDPSHTVWSNGEVQRTETLPDGRVLSHFDATLKMSTFLLALIVAPTADFGCRPYRQIDGKNIRSRVCGRVDILPQLSYADEIAAKALAFFNTYFQIDYPLSKIEHFAVPDFGGGAMENYGLLIYTEAGLFFDEKSVSTSRKQEITLLIAHEVAHQWFGNLVSPSWWTELWLKEGFASYMETLAADSLEPTWKQEEQFIVEKIFDFIEEDALATSRPISIASTNPADIFQLYDSITYSKGAAVIRMMAMFLGKEQFERGIRTYLNAFGYGAATQEDLWKHLSSATNDRIDVGSIMNGWTRQAGYPLVQINRVYGSTRGQMTISQRPFSLFSAFPPNRQWSIPFKSFSQGNESALVWLNETSQTVSIPAADTDWILANPNYLGVYRTKYDERNFRLLVDQLQQDHQRIPTISRGALIDDTFALSRAGMLNATDAYDLIGYLPSETEYVPWMATLAAMDRQEELLSQTNLFVDVQKYFLELLLPLYKKIGWTPIDSSSKWLLSLLQPNLVATVCHYEHPSCIESARAAFRRWNLNPAVNDIPAGLRAVVYCTAVRQNSRSAFDFLWSRLESETIPSETLNLLEGLACADDSSLITWFLDQHLADDSIIRDQDAPWSIANVARSARGNPIVWNWIREHWSVLFEKWGVDDNRLGDIIEALSTRFVTVRQREEFQTFADSLADKGTADRQFQLSTNRIDANVKWIDRNLRSLTAFFRSSNQSSASNYRLPLDIVPTHYDLYVKPYLNITNESIRSSVFDGRVRIDLSVTRPTNRIVLHKRDIVINEPIELTGGVSVTSSSFNEDTDLFTIFLSRTLQTSDQVSLTLNYLGQLSSDTNGFYLSSYVRSADQVRRYLVASQMEPIAARRALPCFDEPSLKATFTVTVEHEREYRAWSNMPVESSATQPNGWMLTRFERSVKMSSYLLALVVADFECITQTNTGRWKNITSSVCAQAEKKESLTYALQIASQSIEDFETQYDISYPLAKCDHIAVPDFDAGAMENFGCVLYRETRLFYNNRTSSSANKQSVAAVIAHELAHQWFGNLVSPAWWDDLWLNEGFAKWMEFVGTNRIHPEWNLFDQFIVQRWLAVMQDDAVSFSHPVNMKLTSNDQLSGIFDTITYSKGSSLLRMLSTLMTDEVFNRGVTRYLQRHLYSTATQADLWRAFDGLQLPDNINLETIMNTWTNQLGYPYVQVTRDYQSGIVTVTQQQFLFDASAQPPPSPYKYLWYIPLQFKSLSNLTWLHQRQMNVTLNAPVASSQWILANPNLLGFFRTNYDRENWQLLARQLKSNPATFTDIERAGLIDDAFNLARASADVLQTSVVFDLLAYAPSENAYIVWERLIAGLSYIEQMIAADIDLYERFQSFVIELIAPIYAKLGWQPSATDSWLTGLHRDLILSMACRQNLDECVQHARLLFDQWLNAPANNPIDANVRTIVYCTAVRRGTRAEFQFLLHTYQRSNDPQEKSRIQSALACTRDPSLIRYLLEIHLDAQLNIIRRQDALSGIRSVCRNLIAENECWLFIRSRWTQFVEQFGDSLSFVDLIKDVTARFNTEQQLDEFERFFEQLSTNGASFQTSLERIRSNIQWVDKAKPNLLEWFNNRTRAIRLPTHWKPLHYELHFDVRLQATYPNNTAPDTRLSGRTHLRVQCRQPTNELRIHVKKLQLSLVTLKRANASTNLISDWTWISASEILLCRLRERCLANEEYLFESEHTSELSRDMSGFYLSQYRQTNDPTVHNIAATHMQPTLARTVFPCFDEPGFKANFSISIIHHSSLTVVRSNGAMRNGGQSLPQPDGRLLSQFEETPPMSTYLVAFVVTDFQCVSNVTDNSIEVNICGRPEAIGRGDGNFALDVSVKVIPYYERSYNIDYPLSKCDQFALPDFAIGGMENWGLITYRETALLYNNATGNLADQRRVGEVVAHELAHQWFGDIVTPQWWNDLWLNEGFASWVEVLGLYHSNPEFDPFETFVSDVVHPVLILDSLLSTHPISVEVNDPDEINSIFDIISYNKGAAILRMIYTVLGESIFFNGVSNYLNYFQYGNAVQDQLWDFLNAAVSPSTLANHSIKTIMDTWTLQEGYPLLTVTRNDTDGSVTLSQQRYFLEPSTDAQALQWYIPFNYMTATSTAASSIDWLGPNQTRVLRNVLVPNRSIAFNIDEFGYYRVNYDPRNWQLLIDELKNNRTLFSSVTRAQLIDDTFNLARSTHLNVTVALQLATYLTDETDYVPFSTFSSNVQYLVLMFSQDPTSLAYRNIQTFIQILARNRYNASDSASSDYFTRQLRTLIIRDLCASGYNACVTDIVSQYRRWRDNPNSNPIPTDLRTVTFCQGIRHGSAADYEHMRELYKQSNDQVEKNRYGYALTCTSNGTVLEQLLHATLANDYIRLQDASRFINNIRLQPGGQPLAWRFISEQWAELVNRFGSVSFTLSGIVESVLEYMNTQQELNAVQAFMASTSDLSTAERAFLSSMEKIRANIRWMNTIGRDASAWLADYTLT